MKKLLIGIFLILFICILCSICGAILYLASKNNTTTTNNQRVEETNDKEIMNNNDNQENKYSQKQNKSHKSKDVTFTLSPNGDSLAFDLPEGFSHRYESYSDNDIFVYLYDQSPYIDPRSDIWDGIAMDIYLYPNQTFRPNEWPEDIKDFIDADENSIYVTSSRYINDNGIKFLIYKTTPEANFGVDYFAKKEINGNTYVLYIRISQEKYYRAFQEIIDTFEFTD